MKKGLRDIMVGASLLLAPAAASPAFAQSAAPSAQSADPVLQAQNEGLAVLVSNGNAIVMSRDTVIVFPYFKGQADMSRMMGISVTGDAKANGVVYGAETRAAKQIGQEILAITRDAKNDTQYRIDRNYSVMKDIHGNLNSIGVAVTGSIKSLVLRMGVGSAIRLGVFKIDDNLADAEKRDKNAVQRFLMRVDLMVQTADSGRAIAIRERDEGQMQAEAINNTNDARAWAKHCIALARAGRKCVR